jgi:hypothetical protein
MPSPAGLKRRPAKKPARERAHPPFRAVSINEDRLAKRLGEAKEGESP